MAVIALLAMFIFSLLFPDKKHEAEAPLEQEAAS